MVVRLMIGLHIFIFSSILCCQPLHVPLVMFGQCSAAVLQLDINTELVGEAAAVTAGRHHGHCSRSGSQESCHPAARPRPLRCPGPGPRPRLPGLLILPRPAPRPRPGAARPFSHSSHAPRPRGVQQQAGAGPAAAAEVPIPPIGRGRC